MKKILATALMILAIAGCGTATISSSPTLQKSTALTAKAVKIDKTAYQSGLNSGLRKASMIYKAGTAIAENAFTENTDPTSYQYGYVCGLLQGSINSFARIDGSFDVSQWKSFCNMNFKAMQDALAALKQNPELAAKYAEAAGILSGGIMSFNSISGSFNVSQWKSFAYSNNTVLQNALAALKKQ